VPGTVHSSFSAAVHSRPSSRHHLYRIVTPKETLYVWHTQPLYATAAALKHLGALAELADVWDIQILEEELAKLSMDELRKLKEYLNEKGG
jgi:hypothetical protein